MQLHRTFILCLFAGLLIACDGSGAAMKADANLAKGTLEKCKKMDPKKAQSDEACKSALKSSATRLMDKASTSAKKLLK